MMSMTSKRDYLKQLQMWYWKSNKKGKTTILNEYIKNTGHNRKYAIQQLNNRQLTRIQSTKRNRKKTYSHLLLRPLKIIYEIFDCPCAQRLKPAIENELERLRDFGEISVTNEEAELLKKMSSATMDRMLSTIRRQCKKRGISTTKPGSLLKKQIPIKLTEWDTRKVGYQEVDLVSHCGGNASGQFAHTISLTEISSGWWEGEAIMSKGQQSTLAGIKKMRLRTPYNWLGIDSDNGGEFINHHLLKYCKDEIIEFSRSRPNHKNDNAYIEQKNWTHVRKIVGYSRYDSSDEIEILNSLYRNELRLQKNFFTPQMKLKSKTRIGGHVKRKYEVAKTPYQRLLESSQLSKEQQACLKKTYQTLNPAQLKRQIDRTMFKLRLACQNKGWDIHDDNSVNRINNSDSYLSNKHMPQAHQIVTK